MRALLSVAALLLSAIWSPAFAQNYPDRASAYAGCTQAGTTFRAQLNAQEGSNKYDQQRCDGFPEVREYRLWIHRAPPINDWIPANSIGGGGTVYTHKWEADCPSPSVWDDVNKQCFNPQRCLDKSALGKGLITGTATSGCIDGCEFAPPDGGKTLSFNGSHFIEIAKGWTPTGRACGVGAPPVNTEDPQVCQDLGDGQTACVKQDGQECYKGPIGTAMQFCWKPGEVGDKNDGSTRQKRNAGETPVAPNLSLPSGDNLQQKGPPITTQVTNNNTTTTTTTTNYQTQHGTDANGGGKPSGDGEPDDGSGKPDDGEGEGTATGGGDCKSPPIVTGDQVLGMVANQAWQTRCAVEAGNAVKVTGDVGDCANPFTVEGTNASAQQLRAMRAQICGDDTNGNKRPDWTETNGTEEPGPGEGDDEPGFLSKTLSLDNLDSSGFLGGAGSCPQMGVVDLSFTQVDLSNASWWCPFVTMCRGILLLMGFFISVRLLME